MKKTILVCLMALFSLSIFARVPITECNQSVFYRTQMKLEEHQNIVFNLVETRLDQDNLQVNIYLGEKIEIWTKYEVPTCKIRSIDIKILN